MPLRTILLVTLMWVAGPAMAAPEQGARSNSPGSMRITTDESFARDVLEPGRPAIVEFWARFCWPCMRLTPHLKNLAAKRGGEVAFWRLNAGWSPESRRKYGFRAVPTLVFYTEGREIARLEGMPSRSTDAELERFVERGLRAAH